MPFPSTSPALDRALADREYAEPTPVQQAVLEAPSDRDLLVSAQTGSGKTVAYGLAFAPNLFGGAEALPRAAEPLSLVVAPTRELALQVHRELSWLYGHANARVVSCVGGMDPRREQRQLAEGAHIVVGTPGRLRDHIERGRLDMSALRAVVLDEADEMLDLGFREDLEFILEATPPQRRTLLFSATMPKAIATLARSYQREALRIEVGGGERGHADIEYRAVRVMPREIGHAVVNILRQVDAPISIVFCNTREAVRHLAAVLLERGFSAVSLSGELSQNERNAALLSLRDGRARVCVATDVAARGIDLPRLGLVIHADLPHDPEVLQHRSGRTGRAGRKGISVLLIPPAKRRRAEQLMATAGMVPTYSGPPTAEEIRRLDQERLLADPLFTEEPGDEDLTLANALLAERKPEEIAAALVRLHRQRLPAPEEVTDPGFAPPRREPREARGVDHGTRQGTWFRLNIGRRNNADPKWLLPMLCRRGSVSRNDIGSIRIFERETKVEVSPEAADRFAAAVHGTESGGIRIEPLVEAPQRENRERPRATQGRRPRD
jgi:ATP-dependent RNA helicase DeaD